MQLDVKSLYNYFATIIICVMCVCIIAESSSAATTSGGWRDTLTIEAAATAPKLKRQRYQ